MKESISVKQAALFCSILLFASKLLAFPSLMYEANNFSSLLIIIAIFAVEFLVLILAIKLKFKLGNISIFSIIKEKIGNFLAKTIFFLIFSFFLLKYLYILQEGFSFLKQVLYPEANIFVFIICIIPVCCALVVKGLKAFARTLEIFYIAIMIGIVFCTVAWAASVFGNGIDFFTTNGLTGALNAAFNYSFWFGDFIFLLLILDKIKLGGENVKVIYKYSFFTMVLIIAFLLAYFILYQNTSFYHTNAILNIIEFSAKIGNVGKLDFIAILTYMFLMYFQAGMFLYVAQSSIKNVIPFKNSSQCLILIHLFVILALIFINNNLTLFFNFYVNYLKYLAIFISYIFPLILFICCAKIKKGEKYAKNH